MAKPNVKINGVTYNTVPYVQIPLSGSSGNASFYYIADGDATAANLLNGKKAYSGSGEITGSMANNGSTSGSISTKNGTVTIPAGYTTGGTVDIASAAVTDLLAANILSGKTILGVTGSLTSATVSQDSTTKALTIS